MLELLLGGQGVLLEFLLLLVDREVELLLELCLSVLLQLEQSTSGKGALLLLDLLESGLSL